MLRPVKLRYYLAVMQSRGVDAAATLANSGIVLDRLSDSSYLIGVEQYRTVVSNMIRLTGNQGIGLDVGSCVRLRDFGIVAHAMLSAKDLRQAAGYWMNYSNLVGLVINIDVMSAHDGWTVVFRPSEQSGFIYNFCVEEAMVTGLRVVAALTGEPVVLKRLQLSYPEPSHSDKYRDFVSCPIDFNTARCAIQVQSPLLDVELAQNDIELNAICEAHCSLTMQQIGTDRSIVASLRALFIKEPGKIPTLDQCADQLSLSPRTLRRRLGQSNTGYQAQVNDFRMSLAKDYLTSEGLSAAAIAEVLGFSDTNAFRRAFKAFYGHSIGDFLATS